MVVRSAVRVDARRAVVRKDMLSVVFGLERKGKCGSANDHQIALKLHALRTVQHVMASKLA